MTEEPREKRIRSKRTKWILIVIIAVLVLLIGAVAAAWFVYDHFYSKSNYVPDPTEIEISSEVLESLQAEEPTIDPYEESRILAELESIREEQQALASMDEEMRRLQSEAEETEAPVEDEVVHLLLVGVDRRTATWNGNSDTMVMLSINRTDMTMTLTSLMRDTAANIPGVGVRKLNNAFAVGGAPLLLQTIQTNFQIPVTDYAWIDFDGMVKVVDILGGVDLFLTVAEAKVVGIDIPAPQVVHLDGQKAVTHARDRSSGGYDYMRTQRQRNVLLAIANKAKSGSLGDLAKVAEQILPYITHNLDRIRLLTYVNDMINISKYTMQEQRIPYDGLYRSVNQNLVPNYDETAKRFRAFVYGEQ